MTLVTALIVLQVAGLFVLLLIWHRLRVAAPHIKAGVRSCDRCGQVLPELTRRTHDGRWLCAACKSTGRR